MSFTYSIKDQLELEFLKLKLGNKKLTKYEVMVLSKSTPGVLDNLAHLWTGEVP